MSRPSLHPSALGYPSVGPREALFTFGLGALLLGLALGLFA